MSDKKAILVGASGKIGRHIADSLRTTHDLVQAGRNGPDVAVDCTNPASTQAMFEQIGSFDALIAVVGGDSVFKHFDDLTEPDYLCGFERKFLAQTRLVHLGQHTANDGASITLSSGFLSDYPNPASVASGPLNAAVDTYVRSAAPPLARGIRLNVVSPAPVVDDGQVREGTSPPAEQLPPTSKPSTFPSPAKSYDHGAAYPTSEPRGRRARDRQPEPESTPAQVPAMRSGQPARDHTSGVNCRSTARS